MTVSQTKEGKNGQAAADKGSLSSPAISLPKGGGAIRGMGEKFAANPVTGTGSMSVPIAISPGRSGFGPQLALSYDSGAGNGPFGFGWALSLPQITRKTDKGLPQYHDAEETDVFILSGVEDLVPVFKKDETTGEWLKDAKGNFVYDETPRDGYLVRRYRPRIEGLFARIERWRNKQSGEVHWRSISRDNITTLYGKTAESRIADPADPTRVFSWLICESHDDKGNAVVYEYKEENSDGVVLSQVHEKNHTPSSRSANRHLKRIRYGNRVSRLVQPDLSQTEWMFEAVFDYGEHHPDDPKPNDAGEWLCRHDPFSSYRAGFEVRTYRLCQRVLMFHHFPEEEEVGQDCLVRSTDFTYNQSPIASFITQVTQSGYVRQTNGQYLKKSLPPLEFEYSEAKIDETVREIDAESLENLPYGLDGGNYQWVDLDGEGVSGILTEQADAWFYKPNLGEGRFGPLTQVARKPSLAALSSGRQQLLDLAGDGQLDLAEFGGPTPGFYERTHDQDWEPFTPFVSLPNIPWDEPNLRFVDLNGDGHADVLISEDNVFTWYLSLAEDGFAAAERVSQSFDEEKGPKLVFADAEQTIYLADLSGDGLTDLVRIRDGEVCYWPNLGYGRFGAKVTMDHAPHFDNPDQFDHKRIRLADIDGTGTTDIIYLHRDGVRLYFNQSGNSWSKPQHLTVFPCVDDLVSIVPADLLGNGTACLVWSSPLPGDARRPMRYVDLMGGQKPHLLIKTVNNLGAETRVAYAPSTKFYLQDKYDGKPWITRLPFPVHVVERVETYDRISQNRFVTRSAYHHGYYDGIEREFRGFGMVEQWDTEEFAALSVSEAFPAGDNIDEASHVPPVLTKTWFHTGAYIGRNHISNFFAGLLDEKDTGEYYREPGLNDEQAKKLLLDDTVLPAGLTFEEEREACRSLRGSMLRQEVYALDGTLKENHPYVVTEQNFTIRRVQPKGGNRHAVFFTHAREAINYHYERNPADPRVSHALTLEVDGFGNVRKSLAIGYGRRQADPQLTVPDQKKQTTTLITYMENEVTNPIDNDPDNYRAPLPSETRTYELTGFKAAGNADRFSFDEWVNNDFALLKSATEIAYEQIADPTQKQKRLIKHVRTLYRKNDLTGLLSLRQVESDALLGESYKLAFRPGLITQVYGGRVTDSILLNEGKYVDFNGDADWWIPSGRVFYSSDPNATSVQELTFARDHFFLPHRFRDQFGNTSTVQYDIYDLLITRTTDPLGNMMQAKNDYRVLQPKLATDPNGNRAEAAFDTFGMVVGTAVMGKVNESKGDSLAGFNADLTQQEIDNFRGDPKTHAVSLLGNATTRIIYDLERYRTAQQPVFAATLARETHFHDPLPPDGLKIQISFSYSDGFGREIQKKIQAEPGPLVEGGPNVSPRWVGNGWTIFNNKGKPVRQYEPFFDDTHDFKFGKQVGVSPVLFYDPVERVVATLHPNHTYEKVVFDPWRQETWDVNDTVLQTDPGNGPDVGDFFRRLPDAQYLPTWHEGRKNGQLGASEKDAAIKAAAHANTPTVAHLDILGRTFLTIADNGAAGKYETRVELDIEGNQRSITDARGNVVMKYDYDMLGTVIRSSSMDSGERWVLSDVTGKPIYGWDSRGHAFRTEYDDLRRLLHAFVKGADPQDPDKEILFELTEYGEDQPNDTQLNLRTRVFRTFDGAGIVTNEEYDFKGNLLRSGRQLAADYKTTPDWSASPALEPEVFTSSTTYDALNRPISLTTPDKSEIKPTFNEANLLEKMDVRLRGASEPTPFVKDIDYNAKGQREFIEYGNGVTTAYEYDPLTFRLMRLQTMRSGTALQDLRYTYDPSGNITSIRDDAQQNIYFNGQVVLPHCDYIYDAIYRLIEAKGREHTGQVGQPETTWNDEFRANLPHPHNGLAMQNYTEQYEYDAVGNFEKLMHQATNANWTRAYAYNEASLIEPAKKNNRLSSTTVGTTSETYTHDAHGNMTKMLHLSQMDWDFEDQLQMADLGGGGKAYYVYDAAGQRVRKVVEKNNGSLIEERIYLGGYEIFRQRNGNGLKLERETLHIMDDTRRIALLETKTVDEGAAVSTPSPLFRYQFGNQLGSASLELDAVGEIISYEEYYPYGSTSYQAGPNTAEVSLKRYRYTGKERDEETGLYYYGARYYAPWLGRWTATDPAGLTEGTALFTYSKNNPISYVDPDGHQGQLSPILYTKKNGEIKITDEQKAKLKQFSELLTNKLQLKSDDIYGGDIDLRFIPLLAEWTLEQTGTKSFFSPRGGNVYNIMCGRGQKCFDRPGNTEVINGSEVPRPAKFIDFTEKNESSPTLGDIEKGIAHYFDKYIFNEKKYPAAGKAILEGQSFEAFARGLKPYGKPAYKTRPLEDHVKGLRMRAKEVITAFRTLYQEDLEKRNDDLAKLRSDLASRDIYDDDPQIGKIFIEMSKAKNDILRLEGTLKDLDLLEKNLDLEIKGQLQGNLIPPPRLL